MLKVFCIFKWINLYIIKFKLRSIEVKYLLGIDDFIGYYVMYRIYNKVICCLYRFGLFIFY